MLGLNPENNYRIIRNNWNVHTFTELRGALVGVLLYYRFCRAMVESVTRILMR
jgi:hypothetical protein